MGQRWIGGVAVGVVGLLVFAQALPYGRHHTNPPVRLEPPWDAPVTREIAVSACFDCHSNATEWPWYSHVAPVSWLIERDVTEGREKVNFSEWDRRQEEADELGEAVRERSMPPWYYPWARLSARERVTLAEGLERTLAASGAGLAGEERETR